jgi:catechol 2,3-dioxygenase-like lactoylglutathione lyase family enzyme
VSPRTIAVTGRTHWHLVVSDMKASIDFYTTVLGFFYDHGTREAAWLRRGELMLTLAPGEPLPSTTQYMGFLLDSETALSAGYDALFLRRQRLSGPPDCPGGRSHFFLYDPDGYSVCFSYAKLDYPP